MRLARFLAKGGVDSRRACETHIRDGLVQVNGHTVRTPACTIDPQTDVILYRGDLVKMDAPTYIVLNKPTGYTCSAKDQHASRLVLELLPRSLGRLFTIGRLDRDSEGLLLLTNDGDFAQRLAHPSNEVLKQYVVWCKGDADRSTLAEMRSGVWNDGDFLKPETVEIVENDGTLAQLKITLTQGRKREIRRLCKTVGLEVRRLLRVAIGPLRLQDLASGEWRRLSAAETRLLQH
ncbi:MAG: rRNA pseudouridine synthase [Lentisphaeria bacterium]|nr:rRNA pseudouridine synthase [Lentisphaeria bacterium]